MRQWKDRTAGRLPASGRSDSRNRRPGDYQEVELGRALVPRQNELPPMNVGAGLPALPGMPTTDEEERALGMRRPVYIPAAGEKRKRRVSGFRVVSGVLSVMLVCIATCAGAALLGGNRIAASLPHIQRTQQTPITYDFSQVPATPVSTPGAAAKYIIGTTTARNVDSSYAPIDPTTHFTVNETVYIAYQVPNVPVNSHHVVSIRWFSRGIDVGLGMVKNQTYSELDPKPGDPHCSSTVCNFNADFALNYPQAGVGMAKIYWDKPASDTGDGATNPYLAQTLYFAIEPPAPTPTPTAGSASPSPTGTQTPATH
jgi:hypothetical protein